MREETDDYGVPDTINQRKKGCQEFFVIDF